jgi:pimeloyl-ACP methyl ester carboxylesterase
MDTVITLQDGRKVEYEAYGDAGGSPALWFHGGFSTRLEASCLDAPARELGLRLLSLDRPGVGGSDPLPGRTIVDYAKDVTEILDQLGIERTAVGGLSNGGMYTMAVAATIPDRVTHAVPVNSTTPVADAAARSALSRSARMQYSILERKPATLIRQVTKPQQPGRLAVALMRRTNPDAHLILDDPTIAAAWEANNAEARRQDPRAFLEIELAQAASDWGFDHRAVPVRVKIVSGEKDAGLGYARIWADELPNGELVVVPGGHIGMLAPAVARRIVELLLA